ncbi:MAG TPA: sulfotransferase domain-containing protein [Caulobacteraceae bacterium]
MSDGPQLEHVYKNFLMDSSRWAAFSPRDGDVLVCTSYKAGTTWTQMICALLIHQTPDPPRPLAELSPWLDMELSSLDDVLAAYQAQTHRRFIKTHTPLDGLPYFENVTYLFCGRDPRDVFMSMQHHMSNADMERLVTILIERGVHFDPPPPVPEDINERFRLWMTTGSLEWEEDGFPFWSHFHHAQTYWKHRHLPNIQFLHYADLKADLEGEMRRVARSLGVTVDEALWPDLVKAASFEDMKSNADRTAPNTDHRIWHSNREFFHTGLNEQWRSVLSEANLQLYQDVKQARFDPSFADWLERGSRVAGDPKRL